MTETHLPNTFSDTSFQDSVPGHVRSSKQGSGSAHVAVSQKRTILKHSDAVNRIRIAVSELGGMSVPYTVGVFRTLDSDRIVRVGMDGVSDVLACIGGIYVGIEIKVGRDTQRRDQTLFQAAVERAGGIYVLARFTDSEDGVETLRRAVG